MVCNTKSELINRKGIKKLSKKKPKLLFISTRFPLPLHSGFANKNFNFLKFFSAFFEITILIISRDKPSDEDHNKMKEYVNQIYIFKPNIKDILVGFIYSIFNKQPLQFALFNSNIAHKKVSEIKDDFDLVFGSVIRSWPYIHNLTIPIYIDLADSLSETYKRNYQTLKNPILKFIYFVESYFARKTEKTLIKNSEAVFLFNRNEVEYLKKYGSVFEVPHGVHDHLLENIESDSKYKNDLIFFGKMDFHPNTDAVFWFVNNVLPDLNKNIRLIIIGASPSKEIINLGKKNSRVIIEGFVDDPYPLILGCLASIAPVRLGGGIQNKVLESLAIGANVICSEMVAKSLPDIEESGVIVSKDKEEWILNINSLYEAKYNLDEIDMRKLYIKKRFTWQAYSESIMAVMEDKNILKLRK